MIDERFAHLPREWCGEWPHSTKMTADEASSVRRTSLSSEQMVLPVGSHPPLPFS